MPAPPTEWVSPAPVDYYPFIWSPANSSAETAYPALPLMAPFANRPNTLSALSVYTVPGISLLTLGAHAHSEGYSSCRVCVCVYVCVYVCMCDHS